MELGIGNAELTIEMACKGVYPESCQIKNKSIRLWKRISVLLGPLLRVRTEEWACSNVIWFARRRTFWQVMRSTARALPRRALPQKNHHRSITVTTYGRKHPKALCTFVPAL